MIKQQDIQKIIQGCCNQNPIYQRQFVDGYGGFLYAICSRYMGNKEEAKDQLQKSMLKILNNISSYDNHKGSLQSWISTIAINTCLTALKKKRVDVCSLSEVSDYGVHARVNPTILDQLHTEDIIKIVQSLPDIYREIFNLVEIEGYGHKEVAQLLGIQVVSSRSRLARAKQQLRKNITLLKTKESWVNQA